MSRKIKFKISGVGADPYHDGQLQCKFLYASSNSDHAIYGKGDYQEILTDHRNELPIVVNFTTDYNYTVNANEGLAALTESGNYFSIYRREYQIYERAKGVYTDPVTMQKSIQMEEKVYQGEWEPVVVNTTQSVIRDFNVTAGRSYQYILYPESTSSRQQFANYQIDGDYAEMGTPVETHWDAWSITELIPVENEVDAPIVRKTYKVDLDNVWLFKYSLETGAQTQNFQKQDIQTLGQFVQLGYGKQDYVSGDVSCLLGSEIVPYTPEGYIERTRMSIRAPLSTNEKTLMLHQWRKLAYSPNPKLLKDIKGQSWIVQIVSNNNTPKNFYKNQPDTISFSWKQIDSTDNIIIYGDGKALPEKGQLDSVWVKKK